MRYIVALRKSLRVAFIFLFSFFFQSVTVHVVAKK